MNMMPQDDETECNVFASIASLCDSLNTATSYLAQEQNDAGFAQMIYIMKALAVFIHVASDSKDVVYTEAEEPSVVPFPMGVGQGKSFRALSLSRPCPGKQISAVCYQA
eukprot:scaffold21293_cov167-Amphora_coffeaeformis.AAC.1